MGMWRGFVSKLQFALRVLLVFAIARLLAGIIIITFVERDAVAWTWGLTLLMAAGIAICFGAALAVRRWAPPRRAN
ncbi:MAG: hypothetical protein WEB52_09640 [Dehalococcoidia bacterium]